VLFITQTSKDESFPSVVIGNDRILENICKKEHYADSYEENSILKTISVPSIPQTKKTSLRPSRLVPNSITRKCPPSNGKARGGNGDSQSR